MSLSRRHALLAGVGLVLTGCASRSRRSVSAYRPSMRWPDVSAPNADAGRIVRAPSPPLPPVAPAPGVGSSLIPAGIPAISRTQWSRGNPVPARLNPMGPIKYLTVHHEGWTPVYFTDTARTAARIEQIRRNHVEHRGWGDIGYHFIVDRAGRIWQGRPLNYQGAHVHDHNPHNIGVLNLGNFEKQSPSDAQLTRLVHTLQALKGDYRVQLGEVFTHQELNPTACPGRNLQRDMVGIRSNGTLA